MEALSIAVSIATHIPYARQLRGTFGDVGWVIDADQPNFDAKNE
jgi:hypothetical protein